MSLLESVLKTVFWNTLPYHVVVVDVKNFSKSLSLQGILNFGKNQKS
jgi:hypothetical protein